MSLRLQPVGSDITPVSVYSFTNGLAARARLDSVAVIDRRRIATRRSPQVNVGEALRAMRVAADTVSSVLPSLNRDSRDTDIWRAYQLLREDARR